ncbi:hypothetical protein LDL59_09765 [Kaistella anthropi]|nr:hypothetical protein [Kaistella anthropi]
MSMERDGYEADKNDIKIMDWKSQKVSNLTKDWDESVVGDVFGLQILRRFIIPQLSEGLSNYSL